MGIVVPLLVLAAVDVGDIVTNIAINLMGPIIQFLGGVEIALTHILIAIVQYNDFLHATAVERGWVIVRDIGNMFFIVVLIIIAFGSILRIQGYRYNQWLFRIVLMALLVNFSKTIAGIFIDFGQVITLTFVNAFKDALAGNFAQLFGLTSILKAGSFNTAALAATGSDAVVTNILAIVLLLVAVGVTLAYVVVFLIRIVALWLLVIFSPMAYVLHTFKQGEQYAQRWWKEFGRYVIIGPVLAFFLWLALALASNTGGVSLTQDLTSTSSRTQSFDTQESSGLGPAAETTALGISEIGKSENLLSFMVGTIILIAALGFVRGSGVYGANFAASVPRRVGRAGLRVAKNPYVQTGLGLGLAGATGGASLLLAGGGLARTSVGRGTARRAGYNVAQGTLRAAANLPLVGGAARAGLSRLTAQRVKAEEKQRDATKGLTPQELRKNADSWSPTETGRANRKLSMERIIKEGLFQEAGINGKAQVGAFIQSYRKLAFESVSPIQKIIPGITGPVSWNSYKYRDPDASGVLKEAYKKSPGQDPEFQQYLTLAKARGDANILAQYFKGKSSSELAEMGAFNSLDANVVGGLKLHYDNNLLKQEQKNDFDRRVNPAILDEMRRLTTPAAASAAALSLRDIDVGRFERTHARAREYASHYGGSDSSFFASKEFSNDPNRFLSEAEYNRAAKNQPAPVREGIGGAAIFGAGQSNVLGFDSRTFAKGRFKDAGEYLTSAEDKRAFAQEATKQVDAEIVKLKTQTTRSQGEQNRLANLLRTKERLANPDELQNLQIVNRARVGYSDRHVIAHERTHAKLDEIDPKQELRQRMREQLAPEQRTDITQRMRKKMNKAEMTDAEAFEEYLTEGMANSYKSWADEAPDAVQLTPGHLQQLQQQAQAAGKPAFAVSGPTPELEDFERSGGAFVSAMQARGYQMAGSLTKAFQQVQRFTAAAIEPAVRVAEGVAGQVRAGVQAATGKVQEVRGAMQLGALSAKRAKSEEAQGKATTVVKGYDELRDFAQRTRRIEREERPVLLNRDEGYKKQVAELDAKRKAAIRRGDVGETNRLSPQIEQIEQYRKDLRTRMEEMTKQRVSAEQEAERARSKVAEPVGRAEERRGDFEQAKAKAGIGPLRTGATTAPAPTPTAPAPRPAPTVPPPAVPQPPQPAEPPPVQPASRSTETVTPPPQFTTPYPGPSSPEPSTQETGERSASAARPPAPPTVQVEPIPVEVLRGLTEGAEGLRDAATKLDASAEALRPGLTQRPESISSVTDNLKLMLEEVKKQREIVKSNPAATQAFESMHNELTDIEDRLRQQPEQSPAGRQLLQKQIQNLTKVLRREPPA